MPAFTHLEHECWIFSIRAMECMCAQTRPRFTLSSKRGLGYGVRTHVNSKGKSPLLEAERRVELVKLHHTEQQAQHTTNWGILAPALCYGSPIQHGTAVDGYPVHSAVTWCHSGRLAPVTMVSPEVRLLISLWRWSSAWPDHAGQKRTVKSACKAALEKDDYHCFYRWEKNAFQTLTGFKCARAWDWPCWQTAEPVIKWWNMIFADVSFLQHQSTANRRTDTLPHTKLHEGSFRKQPLHPDEQPASVILYKQE